MKKDNIKRHHSSFEDAAYSEGDITYWYARDLQRLLEYGKWENFKNVLEKARRACENSGQPIENH